MLKIKINKIIGEMTALTDRVDLIVLKDKRNLSYIFSELYNPPPGEVPIHVIVIDPTTTSATAYISLLDYHRARTIYSEVDALELYPIGTITTPDLKVYTPEEVEGGLREVLRRHKLVALDDLSHCVPGVTCLDARGVMDKVRRQKIDQEVELIRAAARIAEESIEFVSSEVSEGLSELAIAGALEAKARDLGAEGFAFSTIVAIGKNCCEPHHTPTPQVYRRGLPLLIDFGVRVKGYVCDVTRMIVPADLDKDFEGLEHAINAVEEGLRLAYDRIAPNRPCSAIDAVARGHIKLKGLERFFIHALGHGIGVEVHEEPSISPQSLHTLLPYDTITIEPGIYIPNRFGVRIEDDVLVTESGAQRLSSLKHIIVI